MAYIAGSNSSHFGGALSIAEIISTLFSFKMNLDKSNSNWEDRDRFILSKGHFVLLIMQLFVRLDISLKMN